jgi:Na+-transporting NADH:ubiquinone oxidoreductase subunit NqrB
MRDVMLNAAGRGRVSTMKNWRHMAMHAAAAGTFMFLLQRFALNASFESSLLWALTFGGCAAVLAYMQSNR